MKRKKRLWLLRLFVRRLHASSAGVWTMLHGAIVQSQDQGLGETAQTGRDSIHQTRLSHKIMFQFHAHFKHNVHFPKRSSRLLSLILSFVSQASLQLIVSKRLRGIMIQYCQSISIWPLLAAARWRRNRLWGFLNKIHPSVILTDTDWQF